jgi:hypothetical protein
MSRRQSANCSSLRARARETAAGPATVEDWSFCCRPGRPAFPIPHGSVPWITVRSAAHLRPFHSTPPPALHRFRRTDGRAAASYRIIIGEGRAMVAREKPATCPGDVRRKYRAPFMSGPVNTPREQARPSGSTGRSRLAVRPDGWIVCFTTAARPWRLRGPPQVHARSCSSRPQSAIMWARRPSPSPRLRAGGGGTCSSCWSAAGVIT